MYETINNLYFLKKYYYCNNQQNYKNCLKIYFFCIYDKNVTEYFNNHDIN